MRKFQQVTETDDILDELLEGIELAAAEEEEVQEQQTSKKAKKEKKSKKEKSKETAIEAVTPEEEGFNPNGLPMVLERIEAGLIGSLLIKDRMNAPLFKEGDFAQLRRPNRLLPRDFILYKIQGDYFLRRIIKFKEDDIYVAGDSEKEYHIIRKENVIAKAVGRERGKTYLSLGFNPKKKFYTFRKVNLAPLRLGNRVKSYDEDVNAEAFEAAMQQIEVQTQKQEAPVTHTIAADLDLDSDLAAFLDPDELVRELRGQVEDTSEYEGEEEVVYEEEEEAKEITYLEDLGEEGEFHSGSLGEDATDSVEEATEE